MAFNFNLDEVFYYYFHSKEEIYEIEETDTEDQWKIAVGIFTISSLGLCTCVLGILSLIRCRDWTNTCLRLALYESCSAAFVQLAHAVWVAPMMYFNTAMVPFVDTYIATCIVFAGSSQIAATFSCALNRYQAVSRSMHYFTADVRHRRFRNRFFIFGYATLVVMPFLLDPCRPSLHRFAAFYVLRSRMCNSIHHIIAVQVLPVMFLLAHAVLDVLTFLKLKGKNTNDVLHSKGDGNTDTANNKKSAHSHHMQSKFLHQALVFTILRWTAIAIVIVMSQFVNEWRQLTVATIVWLTYNCIEGLVIFLFNFRVVHTPHPSSASLTKLPGAGILARIQRSRPSTITGAPPRNLVVHAPGMPRTQSSL